MHKTIDVLNLYNHNLVSYGLVRDGFNNGKNTQLLVHATGTGKTYIVLALALENSTKDILYVAPTNSIIEHVKEVINSLNLNLTNIKFRTYSSLIEKHEGDLASIKTDYIILDEIHHLGAPVWGSNIEKLIETHPEAKILGLSAYTVRERGTPQEKDMADPTADEIFSNKIVSSYSLVDAMNDKVLPKPIYKSAYLNLIEEERIVEEKLLKKDLNNSEFRELVELLNEAKRQIQKAPSIEDIMIKNIRPNGKYIYFCPPLINEKTATIEEIQKEALKWFKKITNEDNIIFYTSTSKMGIEAKHNREAFYYDKDLEENDVSNKLRVMFTINQYNEGVHAPNVDGVIMGRSTSSDIVFFEQLGRCLSVRANAKEEMEKYMSYSLRQLREECKKRDIVYTDFDTDDILINKLTSPVIIDLVNNYEYIKELENNLRDKIKEEKKSPNRSVLKLNNPTFDIEIENKNIHETLDYVLERLKLSWNDYYEYANNYYNYYNNLDIPYNFRTNDGVNYDQNGFIRLGKWLNLQNRKNNEGSLKQDKIKKLEDIGMVWGETKTTLSFDDYFKYARIFFEKNEHLEIPRQFRTDNGYTYKENGKINLGAWIYYQRSLYKTGKLDEDKISDLISINMRFEDKRTIIPFNDMVNYVNLYIQNNNSVDIPYNFKTNNGYEYDENGKISLGTWVAHRKTDFYTGKISPEKLDKLRSTGLVFDMNNRKRTWEEMYEIAVEYFNKHGNLDIKTAETKEETELKNWLGKQKGLFNKNKLDEDRLQKLTLLKFNTEKVINTWDDSYQLALNYYQEHKTLEMPFEYKTEGGYPLGKWISTQIRFYKNGELTNEKINKLKAIGFNFTNKLMSWDDSYEIAKRHYEIYKTSEVKRDYQFEDFKLGGWIATQRIKYNTNKLTEDQINKLKLIDMRFESKNPSWESMFEYAKKYFGYYSNLDVPNRFKTNDGITEDENGQITLGRWIATQRNKFKNGKLTDNQIRGLEKYGMTWNIAKNAEQKKEILREYGVNFEKDKNLIEKIPLKILEAKIIYCIENRLLIKNEDNTLSDLFFMSNDEFEKNFNISVFDLIEIYCNKNKRGR